MSLIQSAKLNGHDPYVYLKDMLVRCRCRRRCYRQTPAAQLEAGHGLTRGDGRTLTLYYSRNRNTSSLKEGE